MNGQLRYEIILADIKKRIYTQEFAKSRKLPTEQAFAEHYQCSRPTIRKALNKLKEEGLISSAKGSGYFLSEESTIDKSQHLLGIIMQDLGADHIFDSLCDSLASDIAKSGYSLLYGAYFRPDDPELKTKISDICVQYIHLKVCGVFFTPFDYQQNEEINSYILNILSEAEIAVILIDADIVEYPQISDYDLVSLDHIQGGYVLTEHLIKKGAKNPVFLSASLNRRINKLRSIGFFTACNDNNLGICNEKTYALNPNDLDEVEKMLHQMKPDAIICTDENFAKTIIVSFQNLRLTVPDDIMVAGFASKNKLDSSELTSFIQPISEISEEAIRLMFRRLNSPKALKVTSVLPGTLYERLSTQNKSHRR